MKTLFIWALTIITFVNLHAQFKKQPYLLYTNRYQNMKVVFQTYKPGVYIVSYGLSEQYEIGAAQISQLKKGENENIFQYTFKYLQPNSKYFFRITDKSSKVSFYGNFKSAPKNNNDELSFLVTGNTFLNKKISKSTYQFIENKEQFNTFLLHTGNMVNNSESEKGWQKIFSKKSKEKLKLPVIASIGRKETNKALFKKYFRYNYPSVENCYYSCYYGKIKFIVLDKSAELIENSKQYKWLQKELSSDYGFERIVLINSLSSSNKASLSELNQFLESMKVRIVFCNEMVQGASYKQIGRVHYFTTEYYSKAKNKPNPEPTFLAVKYLGQDIFIDRINQKLKVIESYKLRKKG